MPVLLGGSSVAVHVASDIGFVPWFLEDGDYIDHSAEASSGFGAVDAEGFLDLPLVALLGMKESVAELVGIIKQEGVGLQVVAPVALAETKTHFEKMIFYFSSLETRCFRKKSMSPVLGTVLTMSLAMVCRVIVSIPSL